MHVHDLVFAQCFRVPAAHHHPKISVDVAIPKKMYRVPHLPELDRGMGRGMGRNLDVRECNKIDDYIYFIFFSSHL